MTRVTIGNNGITKKYSLTHRGVDIGWHKKESDNIVTAHTSGKVVWLQTGRVHNNNTKGNDTYGNCIKIKHSNGYYTLYAHLQIPLKVKLNQIVETGQELGVMGESGKTLGRHLHFEVRNTKDVRIDPTIYINKDLPNLCTLEKGKYKLLKEKYIRTSPEVKVNNKVLYSHLLSSVKDKCIKDNNGYAKYRIGATVDVTKFEYDNKGNVWAKTKNTYFCIQDKTGLQASKV